MVMIVIGVNDVNAVSNGRSPTLAGRLFATLVAIAVRSRSATEVRE
ncbi:hypothetical protein [Fodinicola feengrottensis]|nr:hypothetical protein [Fodinicola feengrottensis]